MIFFSDKADKNGARVAARLQKELGAAAAPAYETEVEGTAFRPKSIGSALRESFAELSKGGPTIRPMYTFHLVFEQPRAFWLDVNVVNAGGITVVGGLCYWTRLRGRLATEVSLEDEKAVRRSRFHGDATGSEQLNSAAGLVKRANRLLRGELELRDGEKVTVHRDLRVAPDENGVLLSALTLPRKAWFGLSARFDAAEFVAIAGLVETALGG
jgi:hypothetical protein